MKDRTVLVLILFLAFSLRFWKLGSYPAINADEASIGYDAYSLIQTGRDQHGNSWPIHFQSFNDYKPGLYIYLVIPFVKLLGLTEWAVRIPGALTGVITVWVLYLLVKEVFGKKDYSLATIASFLLAISPWHVHFSRGGWEVNVATLFIVMGVLFFLKSLKTPRYFVVSSLLFVLSLYAYHSARVITPLLVFGLLLIHKRDALVRWKYLMASFVIGILLLVPLARELFGPAGVSRAAGVGLLADMGPVSRVEEQRIEHGDYKSWSARLVHNKVVNYGLAFLNNWGEHFWGEFLFLSGDEIQRDRVPETGQFYLFQLPLLLTGLWFFAKRFDKNKAFILWWLAISPAAAALTFQSPHALRAQNMVVPLTIISAYGLVKVFEVLKIYAVYVLRVSCLVLLFSLIVWEFLRYEHMYWVHMAKEYPYSSQYGVKELVDYIKNDSNEYDSIIVTDRYDQPYILFLFYLQYPPQEFQKDHTLTARDGYGFSTVREFSNYKFESVKFEEMRKNNPNSLIIGTDSEIPEDVIIVKDIYGSNGFRYFKVVRN